jgi:hypothetical protein
MLRILAWLLALLLIANGLFMLFRPEPWYFAVPGAADTGPFNRHFVNDIGAAFLVAGAGTAWAAWRPERGWPALVAGTGFLALHALIHLVEVASGDHGGQALVRDFPGVYLPTLVALFLVLKLRTYNKANSLPKRQTQALRE